MADLDYDSHPTELVAPGVSCTFGFIPFMNRV